VNDDEIRSVCMELDVRAEMVADFASGSGYSAVTEPIGTLRTHMPGLGSHDDCANRKSKGEKPHEGSHP
jgi:hypothetical protein